ncbi:hypothetical protein AGMMS4956_10660 [Bacteroidia bacterium]|nr:hypothetical protein AGMMS4956_10660 [Bacteroidia bacterium]
MVSCGKDEVDVSLNDTTVGVRTYQVNDRQGSAVAGATVTANNGATTTTDANGVATLSLPTSGNFIITISKDGYAAITANYPGSVTLPKMGGKLAGIATYTDQNGNLDVVPSGTTLAVVLDGNYVKKNYTTTVGANGKYEFPLPENCDGYFVSPVTISSDKYAISSIYFYSNSVGTADAPGTSRSVSLTYIAPPAEPFAIVAFPGTVTATGSVIIKFSSAADDISSYVNNAYNTSTGNISVTSVWSADKKTLTLTPTGGSWGTAEDRFYISGSAYDKDGVSGVNLRYPDGGSTKYITIK